jgi:hypothetical protein
MIIYDSRVGARLAKGEIDHFDALTFVFDSGPLSLYQGLRPFDWEDTQIGNQTFIGVGALLSIAFPAVKVGNESTAVTVRLAETYMPAGSDVPVNIFDADVRASIDDEPWQGRPVILSRFHRDQDGTVLMREQIGIRFMNDMPMEEDSEGRPVRVVMLEREDIIQREIEGKTDNADFQAQIDPDDAAFQHVGQTATQAITFGALPTQAVS